MESGDHDFFVGKSNNVCFLCLIYLLPSSRISLPRRPDDSDNNCASVIMRVRSLRVINWSYSNHVAIRNQFNTFRVIQLIGPSIHSLRENSTRLDPWSFPTATMSLLPSFSINLVTSWSLKLLDLSKTLYKSLETSWATACQAFECLENRVWEMYRAVIIVTVAKCTASKMITEINPEQPPCALHRLAVNTVHAEDTATLSDLAKVFRLWR